MKAIVSFAAALSLLLPGTAGGQQPQAQRLAIVGATVLPMTDRERLANQTVLIEGERIVAVGPSGPVRVPAGYRTVDGRGRFLMPGLVDMHVHIAPTTGEPDDSAHRALAVMLAHGVTTARSMVGAPNNLVVRRKVEAGTVPGPRLYLAAPFFTDARTPSAEAARSAVATANRDGFDFVKFVSVSSPATVAAVHDAAREAKLGVAGHVSNAIGARAAAAAGQQIEHLDGMLVSLLRPGAGPTDAFGQFPPPAVIRSLAGLGDAEIDEYVRSLPRTWHVPTLALFERLLDASTPTETLRAAPELRFVAPAVLDQWAESRKAFAQIGYTANDARVFVDLRRRLAGALHRAGAPVMPGSDTAQAFQIWGPGLHREIQALARAGLTPMQALRSATRIPRDYFRSLPNGGSTLGWTADFGTVEPGARADLILLDADPSRDLKALGRIDSVIAAGRLFNRRALDAMLRRAAAAARTARVQAPVVQARQVYVVRHFEKLPGDDPGLTAEGTARAAQLAAILADKNIQSIFVTDTRRARESAAQLVARLGIQPTLYDPRKPEALALAVAAAGGSVLVVGHSNTVPDLVQRFGGTPPAPLSDKDYGTMWTIDPAAKQTSASRVGN